ncbi:MAG: hypothetical protein EB127_05350 [Alphaproteobacteria bacterium]|nr:hypothetical protein [Alphaproteobacteria bacterium]
MATLGISYGWSPAPQVQNKPNGIPMPQYDIGQGISDYGQMTSGAIGVQANNLVQASNLEAGAIPQLQQNFIDKYENQVTGLLGLQLGMLGKTGQFQNQYSNQMLGMQGNLMRGAIGAQYNAMDAGGRGLYDQINQQALSGLRMGSSLSAEDKAYAQQSARAAAEARGINFSRQGSDLEVLNSYNLGQARLKERQAQANLAYGNSQKLQEMGAASIYSPNLQSSQQAGLYGQLSMANQAMGALAPSMLSPESQYFANIRNSQMQQQYAYEALNWMYGPNSFNRFGGATTLTSKPSTPNNFRNNYIDNNPMLGLASYNAL